MQNLLTPNDALFGLPSIFAYLAAFILGSLVGSFLNVVIYRVPRGLSVVFPNSKCPRCETPIKPYDNIPIFGWLMLGGKCRSCKAKISAQYPLVELIIASLWVLIVWRVGLSIVLPFELIFVTAIVALIFIDAQHKLLPDVITKPGIVFSVLARLVIPLTFGISYFDDLKHAPLTYFSQLPVWLNSLIGAGFGALIGGGILWFFGWLWLKLRGIEGMGGGDVKMLYAVGAFLGWRLTLLTIFLGAFSGAVIGVAYQSTQKDKNMQSEIPFGIFLGIGAIIALFYGENIIGWYAANFLPN